MPSSDTATSKKISELPNAQPLTGQEYIPMVQDGETRKAPLHTLPSLSSPEPTVTTLDGGLF